MYENVKISAIKNKQIQGKNIHQQMSTYRTDKLNCRILMQWNTIQQYKE